MRHDRDRIFAGTDRAFHIGNGDSDGSDSQAAKEKEKRQQQQSGKARRISELEPIQPDTPKRSTLT